MPAIKFDEQQRAKGLRELILHGDVYCLPDHIFIVPLNSLRFLDEANISYAFVDGELNQTFLSNFLYHVSRI
jgi:hypothetical protein